MRDIPGVAWILGIFMFCAIGIFGYSRLGPASIPPPSLVWKYMEDFRDNIQNRKASLQSGQVIELNEPPYQIHIERLANQKVDANEISKYLIQIQPVGTLPVDKPWLGMGVEFGLVDFKPNETVGKTQWVSFHKQAEVK